MRMKRNLARLTLLGFIIAGVAYSSAGAVETQPNTQKPEDAQAPAKAKMENDILRTVPFITFRDKTGEKEDAEVFGSGRSGGYAGYCHVSRISLEKLKDLAGKASVYIPEDIVELDAIRVKPAEDLWRGMERTTNGRRPVLYSHGFYISFSRGCRRASMFQKNLGLEGRSILFSWPSDGSVLNYTRDEADLYWSVAPLVETLNDMTRRFGAGGSDVVAHSLGTRGVFLALVKIALAKRINKPLFNQIVLLAPDIDAGIFKQYLHLVRPLAKNITVYVSGNDSPLALSRQVHGHPRLGEAGAHLNDLKGIEIIDLSDIPVRYPSGHVYHLYNDFAIKDLNQLLNGGKQASQRSNLKQTGKNYWRLQPPVTGKQAKNAR